MIVYPNSYCVNSDDTDSTKRLRCNFAKMIYKVLPKLIRHGLNESKEKMAEIFKPYGVELWQLESAAA